MIRVDRLKPTAGPADVRDMATLLDQSTPTPDPYGTAVERLTGPAARVVAHVSGRGEYRRWASLAIVAAAAAVGAGLASVTAGRLLFPALCIPVAALAFAQPRRGVSVTPTHLLVTRDAPFGRTPRQLLAAVPVGELPSVDAGGPGRTGRSVALDLPFERIRVRRADYRSLVTAATTAPGC